MTGHYWIMTEDGLRLLDDFKNDLKDGKLDNKGPADIKTIEPSNKQEIEQMKKELDEM